MKISNGGTADLLKMHYDNTVNAHTAMKASTGSHKEFTEKLLSLACIALTAYEKMTCDKK